MASVIIPARKSLTITDKFPNRNINKGIMSIGNDGFHNYLSYLFFDISSIPCNVSICHAELVLFKVDNFYNNPSKTLGIYPLNECFNTYTSFCNYPEINPTLTKAFYPLISNAFVRVGITPFVRLWIRNRCINNSIMLYGKNKKSLVHFASTICTNKHLIPFLKVTFTPCCNKPTLKQVQVIGTVAPQSKYEAVVNIQVSRQFSNHIDNYYVVDEYDNSTNKTALHVDKTYNVAIIPRKTVGDVENLTFYGSYKE